MDTVCHTDRTISDFDENWSKYGSVISQYSMTHSFRSKEVKEALMPLIDDDLPDNQSVFEFGMSIGFFRILINNYYSIADDFTDIHSVCTEVLEHIFSTQNY